MTGAWLRVKRDDKFENVEVEHLTDAELEEKFSSRDPAELVNWIKLLCGTIRRLEPLLAELVRDGILTLADRNCLASAYDAIRYRKGTLTPEGVFVKEEQKHDKA